LQDYTDPSQLMNFLQNENSQTIALIMTYLNPEQSASLLSSLPPEKQVDIARRVATMDRTSPEVIMEVEKVLERQMASVVTEDYTNVGGIQAVVNILNNVDRGTSFLGCNGFCGKTRRRTPFCFRHICFLPDKMAY
jgi:flagellar motor switch protein FliG